MSKCQKINQNDKEKIKASLIVFLRSVKESIAENEYYLVFSQQSAKSQAKFIKETAQQFKIQENAVKQYIFEEFAADYMYKLNNEDKMMIKAICQEMKGASYLDIYKRVTDILLQQDKQPLQEQIRSSIHYYMKQIDGEGKK